ncbi:MAG TPA: TlpA disulfide reductase family protein [Pseudolabrys sp.]|nr:TlpA disulfide reductase family protein [Pseudolabrys sp.]
MIAVAVLAGAGAGFAAVYGIAGFQRNAANQVCGPAVNLAQKVAPLARGEVAAVNLDKSPLKLPDVTFEDGSGAKHSLDQWHGRTVLLNLWATWCVPCRKEMPALDALEQRLGGPDFQVVAVNIDTRNLDKPKAFLKEVGVHNLGYYADPNATIFQDLKEIGRAFGMPTTVLVDPLGCEIGSIAGPAEWASDDAIKLIKAVLKK